MTLIRWGLTGLLLGLVLSGSPACVTPDAGTPDVGMPDAGAPDAGAPDAGEAYTSAEAFLADLQAARCAGLVACGAALADSGCREAEEPGGSEGAQEQHHLEAALEDGRVRLDGAAARRCVTQAQAATCSTFPGVQAGADCRAALVGTVALEGACYDSRECVPGASCVVAPGGCPGVCKARVAQGQVAGEGEACAEGLFRNEEDGVCTPLVPLGESCAGPWGLTLPCGEGALCSDAQRCEPLVPKSGSCTYSSQCQAPYVCQGGTCAEPGDVGATCDPSVPCRLGLFCDESAEGGAACAPLKAVDGSCFSTTHCQPGLLCRGVSYDVDPPTPGTCQPPAAAGADCNPDTWEAQCEASAYCDTTTRKCTTRGALGEACPAHIDESCHFLLGCIEPEGGGTATCQQTHCADLN